MRALTNEDASLFSDAIQGLKAGDFSRLEPLFGDPSLAEGDRCQIVEWYEDGQFADEPIALQEALTCACFLGRTRVVEYLLGQDVDLAAGTGTGLNGFHWAANRGQLETIMLLINQGAPLETKNMYGGTVLSTAVWSAINEPKADHILIIETLIKAGASVDEVDYPTGNERVDSVLRRP